MKPSNNARIVVCTNGWSMDVGEEEETSRPMSLRARLQREGFREHVLKLFYFGIS